jgi:hypothetical protein
MHCMILINDYLGINNNDQFFVFNKIALIYICQKLTELKEFFLTGFNNCFSVIARASR